MHALDAPVTARSVSEPVDIKRGRRDIEARLVPGVRRDGRLGVVSDMPEEIPRLEKTRLTPEVLKTCLDVRGPLIGNHLHEEFYTFRFIGLHTRLKCNVYCPF